MTAPPANENFLQNRLNSETNTKTMPPKQYKPKTKTPKGPREERQHVSPEHKVVQRRGRARANRAVSRVLSPYNTDNGALLARQMAIPETIDTLARVPTPDMPRTAQIRVTTTHTMRNAVYAGSVPSFSQSNGDLVVLAYGLPGLSHMYGPVINTNALNATTQQFYYMDSNAGTGPASGTCPLTRTTMQPGTSVESQWTPNKNVSMASGSIGQSKALGLSGSRVYAWFDPSEKIVFTFAEGTTYPATIPVGFTIQIYQWAGPGEALDNVATLSYNKGAAGVNSYTIPASGWYSMSFAVSAMDSDTITAQMGVVVIAQAAVANPATMVLVHQEPLQNPEVGESVRRTAYSLLITNTSAEINKQGSIIAARLVNDGLWNTALGATSMTVAHLDRAADKYTGPAQHGCYTYMDFDQENERFFQAHFGEELTTSAGPCFNMEMYGYLHMIRVTNPSPSTLTNDFLVTVTAVYEFRSDSMLFSKDVPALEYGSLIAARRVNNSTPYFYENPLHLGDVWNRIRSAFNTARRAAIPLGMAASAIYPEASGLIMPVARALQRT